MKQPRRCKHCGRLFSRSRARYCSDDCRNERWYLTRPFIGIQTRLALAFLAARGVWVASDSQPFDSLTLRICPLAEAKLFLSDTGRPILHHRITQWGRVVLRYWRICGAVREGDYVAAG